MASAGVLPLRTGDWSSTLRSLDSPATRGTREPACGAFGPAPDSVDALGAAGPLPIAQDELLDLPGGRLRQLAELDGGGTLEMGDLPPAELDDLLLSGLHARLERDEGLRPLAPLLVRDGDHRALEDGGVPGDRLLDLDGRDVLAARDDDVLLPVAQLDVAVGMPDADVARVEPAAAEGLGGGVGLLEVTLHDVVPAHDDLAQRLAVLADVAHVAAHDPHEIGDRVRLALARGQPRPDPAGLAPPEAGVGAADRRDPPREAPAIAVEHG